MLYSAEKSYTRHGEYVCLAGGGRESARRGRLTITPKLKLSEQARNTLLSWMRKLRLLGIKRTRISTQIMLEPATQARVIISERRPGALPPERTALDQPVAYRYRSRRP